MYSLDSPLTHCRWARRHVLETGEGLDTAGSAVADVDSTQPADSTDGDSVEVAGTVAQAIDSYFVEFGQPVDVEENENGTLVSFEESNYLAHAEKIGAHPVIGMIAQSWVDEDGLDAEVGLPTASEEAHADGNLGSEMDTTSGD